MRAAPKDKVLQYDDGYSSDEVGNAFMTEFASKNMNKGLKDDDLKIQMYKRGKLRTKKEK